MTTLEELQSFLKTVGSFHDGIIKEVHWINRDYVAESLSMRAYQLADASMLVQRQWAEPSAVEIQFESVWKMHLDTVNFVFDSSAGTEMSSATLGDARSLLVLNIEYSSVAFEKMRWRDASDWMGPDVRL